MIVAGVALGALLLLVLVTAALILVALLHGRVEVHDARLDALERDAVPVGDDLDAAPPDVEPPRAPIGFRRE